MVAKVADLLILDEISRSECLLLSHLLSSRLHNVEAEARQHLAEVALLYDEGRRVTNRNEVPERGHLRQVGLEKLPMQLPQQCFELLAYVLHCAAMEQDKIEDLCALANIFVPLSEAASCSLCLH